MPLDPDLKVWPRIFRDPVHDSVAFENEPIDKMLLALVRAKEFQRLRRVKQLGMSEFVFPGAVHTRFSHSIGVMHTARKFLSRVDRIERKLTEDERALVLAASLIHDVGHGPFSHTFEKVSGEDHEKRTLEIIRDDSTEINKALRDYSSDFPERISSFFETGASKFVYPAFLSEIVSSQLDADRFDYLLRDSLFTGTGYGRFDFDWIIGHIYVDNGRFFLSHKAIFPAEQYIYCRYHMYRIVYFHKTTRAAEVMLRLLFQRYTQLLK